MTAFDLLWADAVADMEAAFGEQVRIEPYIVPVGRGVPHPDPERAIGETVGRFQAKPGTADLEGSREGTRLQGMTRLASVTPTLKLSAEAVARLGFRPRGGDRLVLIERPGEPTYSIASVGGHDGGNLDIGLVPT